MSIVRHPYKLPLSIHILIMLWLFAGNAWSQGQEIKFSVIGDVPYGDSEVPVFQGYIDDHNRYSEAEFFVHVGDIKSGGGSCDEYHYTQTADILKDLEVPAYIILGDNEWTDCSDDNQALSYWMEHLFHIEQNFCGLPTIFYQDERPENFAFIQKGVLFMGVNMPSGSGGNASQRLEDNANWVEYYFENYVQSVRAAVVFGHSDSGDEFINRFDAAAATFAKPVIYIMGNGHSWKWDNPFNAENAMRMQVDNGGAGPPVEITVTMDSQDPFLYDRDPWPPGTPEVVRTPCGTPQPYISIADAQITEGDFGFLEMVFDVELFNSDGNDASVDFTTSDNTAHANEDYQPASGTLHFQNGSTFETISIQIIGDLNYEGDEDFNVELSGAANAGIGDPTGIGTIEDNETAPLPVLTSFDPQVGTSGETIAISGQFLSSISEVSFNNVSADFNIESESLINAVVPSGATSGPISILNDSESATSQDDFTIKYKLFSDLIGSGQVILSPEKSSYDFGEVVDLFANASPNWQFAGWQGDLSGTNNPASIIMDDDKQVTALFVDPTQPANLVLNPIADSHVKLGSSNNYGTEPDIRTKVSNSIYNGYLKFEVTGLGGSVQNATLRLYVVDPGGGGPVSVHSVSNNYLGTSDPWLEDGIVSSNAPDLGTPVHSLNLITLNTWAEFDVTSTVSGSGTISFGLSNPNSSSIYYSSKEGINPPELVIETGSGGSTAQYTLSTSVQGNGSVDPSGGSYDDGTDITLTAQPASGWQFVEWQGEASGTNVQTTITMDANKSVTAVFSEIPATQYTLSTSVQGSGSVDPSGGSYDEGTEVTLTAQPASGWQFVEWQGDASGTNTQTTVTMDGNKSVTAVFVNPTPPSSLVLNPIEDAHVKLGSDSNYGTEPDIRTKVSNSIYNGYLKFEVPGLGGSVESAILRMYVVDPGGGGPVSVHSTSNNYQGTSDPWLEEGITSVNAPDLVDPPVHTLNTLTVNAWAEFDVTSVVNGTGPVSLGLSNPNTSSIYYSSKEGINPPELVINSGSGNTATTATYTLATSSQGNGSVDPSGGSYDDGTEVTLTAQPASGWQFLEWQGDAVGTNAQTTVNMDGNKSVTAVFSEIPATQYALAISAQGSGSVDPSGGTYDDGTEVTLTAQPSPGWQFLEWQGDASGTNAQTTITMDANKSVTAIFNETTSTQYTLATTVQGNGSISPSGGSYSAGSQVTLTAQPASGWQFVEWQGDASGNNAQTTVTMDANKNATAIFNELQLGTMEIVINTDDEYELWVNGDLVGSNNQWDIAQIYTVPLQPAENVLAVHTVNTGYPGALIAEVRVNDQVVLITDDSWRRSGNPESGWQQNGFDDNGWLQAVSHGQYGTEPWNTGIANFPTNSNAHWIWGEVLYEDYREWYFRGSFTQILAKTGLAASHVQLDMDPDNIEIPTSFELSHNYPNPFNPSTTLQYQLPEEANVRLAVFDSRGRVVSELVDGPRPAGIHSVTWRAVDSQGLPLPSGIYFYRITAGSFTMTRKMLLLK